MNELVSIVIPVYNISSYLEECLNSIIMQTYKELEVLVVDDGSQDDSLSICKKFALIDDRFRVIHQENKGVVGARQTGIENATGKYIAFIDGDDWIDEDMIQTMVDALGDSDMVCAGVNWEKEKDCFCNKRDLFDVGVYQGESLDKIRQNMIYDLERNLSHPITTWMFNKLYTTNKVKKIHKSIDRQLKFSEDAVFVYRYFLECEKVTITDSYKYHYRYREESALHKNDTKRLANISNTYNELLGTIKDKPDEYRLHEQCHRWLLERCYIALNEKMSIEKEYRMVRHFIDCRELYDKRIVLYGAGQVGKDIFFQLCKLKQNIVLWIDKRSEEMKKDGWPVSSISDLKQINYDCLIIAIESNNTREAVRNELVMKGVSDDAIWSGDIISFF